MSYAEFCLIPEDTKRHELIAGVHSIAPSCTLRHQTASGNLLIPLLSWVKDRNLGFVYFNLEVVLSDEDAVRPDLVFISEQRSWIETEQGATGAPDLVIEILSDYSFELDQTVKFNLYEQTGVPEYWIVDTDLKTVRVYRLKDGTYERTAELSSEAGDRLETPLLPGLVIELSRIFE